MSCLTELYFSSTGVRLEMVNVLSLSAAFEDIGRARKSTWDGFRRPLRSRWAWSLGAGCGSSCPFLSIDCRGAHRHSGAPPRESPPRSLAYAGGASGVSACRGTPEARPYRKQNSLLTESLPSGQPLLPRTRGPPASPGHPAWSPRLLHIERERPGKYSCIRYQRTHRAGVALPRWAAPPRPGSAVRAPAPPGCAPAAARSRRGLVGYRPADPAAFRRGFPVRPRRAGPASPPARPAGRRPAGRSHGAGWRRGSAAGARRPRWRPWPAPVDRARRWAG